MATKTNYKRLLLIQFIGVLHCVEEYYFGFSDWATRHFGTITQSWYILSHIFIFFILGVLAIYAYKGSRLGIFFAYVVQILLFTNGLFHIFSTVLWNEYSPGVMAQLLVIPITYIVYKGIRKNELLSITEMRWATIAGCIVSAFIIASLWIDVPI